VYSGGAMPDGTLSKPPYWRRLIEFYLTPSIFALPRILFLLIFSYSAVFYAGNIWVAFKFIFYTVRNSAALAGVSYVLWGSVFLVGLIAPFVASVYTIILLYAIWESDRSRYHKILSGIFLTLGTLILVLVLDGAVHLVAGELIFSDFVVLNGLSIRGL